MNPVSIKLPEEISTRAEALKDLTGIPESALLRQAIIAGLPIVEKGHALIHEGISDLDPTIQVVS